MTKMDILHRDQNSDHTDIFITKNKDNDVYDFVTIDDTYADLPDAVVIDISNDEIFDEFTIDTDYDPDLFVTLDHDVIVSGFTDEDFNSTIVDLDIINNNQEI